MRNKNLPVRLAAVIAVCIAARLFYWYVVYIPFYFGLWYDDRPTKANRDTVAVMYMLDDEVKKNIMYIRQDKENPVEVIIRLNSSPDEFIKEHINADIRDLSKIKNISVGDSVWLYDLIETDEGKEKNYFPILKFIGGRDGSTAVYVRYAEVSGQRFTDIEPLDTSERLVKASPFEKLRIIGANLKIEKNYGALSWN